MNNENIIHSLESIPEPTIYSKYGSSLKRSFKSRSLKNFIYELKNPKKLAQKDDDESFRKKKHIDDDNSDIFSDYHPSPKKKDNEKENKKTIDFKPKYHTKIKEFNDPFKYNPNYNCISKNIPSVRIILTEREKKEFNEMNKKRISPHKKIKKRTENELYKNLSIKKDDYCRNKNEEKFNFITENNIISKSRNNSPKRDGQSLPPITKVPEQKRMLTLDNDNDRSFKNNHALRFSKYTNRRYINNSLNDKVSYLEPYDYLKNKRNIIDFCKMVERDDKNFINYPSLAIPSFNNYNPKYDLVEKKPNIAIIVPNTEKRNNKKTLLKRLWCSYDVNYEYQLIDNNKLATKINLRK